MPGDVTYPGVYVEELPSAEKGVSGISTSTAAFVDFFARGPMSDAQYANPVQISSFRDFQRNFGGLQSKSEASYGVLQFFNNGGEAAFVVRCDDGTGRQASRRLNVRGPFHETDDETAAAKHPVDATETGEAPSLEIAATSPGVWGNALKAQVVSRAECMFDRALEWAVFEGNDEDLWREIRQQVGGFLSRLFAAGAFAGEKPDRAYFVRCDSTTTTSADVAKGIVNVVVGIAPSKPAEFIILQIEQVAGQA